MTGGEPLAGDASRPTARWTARAIAVIVVVWAIATGLLVLCGEGIKHSNSIKSADRSVTAFAVAHRTAALDQLMKIVSWAGSWIALAAVALIVAGLAKRRRLPLFAVIAVLVAWGGELLAVTVTKAVVKRPRPPEALRLVKAHGWAFPSGHTANATVVFAVGACLVTVFAGKQSWRTGAWVLAVLATALVGYSRIELGVHWMTDVLASAVWTICWLVIVVRIFRLDRPASLRTDRAGTGELTA